MSNWRTGEINWRGAGSRMLGLSVTNVERIAGVRQPVTMSADWFAAGLAAV